VIKRNWFWIIGGVVLTIVLIFGVKQLLFPATAKALTEEDIQRVVEERYAGQVTKVVRDDHKYLVDLTRDTDIYKVMLDANTGEVISLSKSTETEPKVEDKDVEKDVLTEKEVEAIVLKNTAGEIKSIKLDSIEGEKQVYQAVVKVENQQTTYTVDPKSGEIITTQSETIKDPPKKLTEKEAGQIALQEVQGEIDDIDLETVGSVSYFYVEIETADGHDAIVEINAITGEVKSITWDDED